jgi:hypothetical protein
VSSDATPVVSALRQLPGVSSAEADHEPGGGVTALRVALAPGVDRLAVEAAVRRVCRAHFGGTHDEDRVRIAPATAARQDAEASPEPPPAAPATPGGRPHVLRTDVTTEGAEVTATVVLAVASRTGTGLCRGVVTGGGVRRAVATATLRALQGLLPGPVHLELEDVHAQRAQDDVVLVRLSLVSERGAQPLVGTALVRHDESDAVVRATLDAANRRVGALLS